jgi:Pyruvate/2-oxoacid:ferredoxin oxidoreductase delta subunit
VVLFDKVQITEIAPDAVYFSKDGADMRIKCDQVIVENAYVAEVPAGDEDTLVITSAKITNIISAITAGKNAAAGIDKLIRGEEATLSAVAPVKTVSAEAVRQRSGYLKRDVNPVALAEKATDRKDNFDAYKRVMTAAEAVKEAERCLNCGCGEGCQLCKTICTDFAPEIVDADTMHIRSEKCVACGMCFNRCPNGNIEMLNLGYTV